MTGDHHDFFDGDRHENRELFPELEADPGESGIATREELVRETAAWQRARNEHQHGVDWQFTTADARLKLKRLYPRVIS